MEQSTQSTERRPTKKSPSGMLGRLSQVVILMVLISLLAWILLGVGFGLHQVLYGPRQTQARMNAIMDRNMAVMQSDTHFIVSYAAFEASDTGLFKEILARAPWLKQTLNHWQAVLQQQAPTLQLSLASLWRKTIEPFAAVLWGVTLIVLTRGFILLLAVPVFSLWVGLGFVDGLVQRDVRKFQAARESTYVFHRLRNARRACLLIPLFLYFIWPWATPPVWFLMPTAVVLGWMTQMSVTSFKKYL